MTFPKYKELDGFLDPIQIDKEIWILEKSLFEKKLANNSIKPHIITHTKHRLAQLKYKKSLLLKEKI
jgi:hypothetical protein